MQAGVIAPAVSVAGQNIFLDGNVVGGHVSVVSAFVEKVNMKASLLYKRITFGASLLNSKDVQQARNTLTPRFRFAK